MDGIIKQYKKSILGHELKIKELEITLERQNFYKEVVDEGKIKDTLRHISILKTEIEAFKKQTPRSPEYNIESFLCCPVCWRPYTSKVSMGEYCDQCGQRLE